MAVLNSIRKRTAILLIVLSVAIILFLLMDILQTGGFNRTSTNAGEVNGVEIPFADFNQRVNNYQKSDPNMSLSQASNSLWNQEISRILLTEQADKLGIRASVKHMTDVLKQNPQFAQQFSNNLGEFDLKKFNEFIATIKDPQMRKAYLGLEDEARTNAKQQIYYNLARGGYFVTQADAKFAYELENNKVNFNFVHVPYTSIPDTDVKVSDEEILAYIKKYPKKYKAEEVRELQYVVIEEKASAQDKAEIETSINAMKSIFDEITDKTELLEYVNANSDIAYDSTFVTKSTLPAEHADAIYNLAPGTSFGPYEFNNHLVVSRMESRKSGAKVRASHILISWDGAGPQTKQPRTKEEAKAKADELLAQVQADSNQFLMLAFQNSEDQGSAQRGGDLDFFEQGKMVKAFDDFCFNNPINKIGLVETEFGYHIIKVTDKQDGIRIATLAKKIEPSQKSIDEAFTKATKFEMTATEKSFAEALKEAKLTENPNAKVQPADENVGIAGPQRNIVRWAFENNTSKGDINRLDLPNVGYVVVKLVNINNSGLLDAEQARPMVENTIRNEKKAQLIIKKMAGSSLADIAKKNKVEVSKAAAISLSSPMLPNSGFEPKVVGAAFGLSPKKVSKPIEGTTGVYVVSTETLTKAPAAKDYTAQITNLKSQANQGSGSIFTSLKDKAKIEDNRVELGL
jgi:peptidyl-prolyl cis-trans isomerase D